MINEERLLNEFLELVQIDSETKYEAQIAKVLKKNSGILGLRCTKMIQLHRPDTVQVTSSALFRELKKEQIQFISLPIWIRLFLEKELNLPSRTAML